MIYIIGNSHTSAIRRGLEMIDQPSVEICAFPIGPTPIELEPIARLKNKQLHFNDEVARNRFKKMTGDACITKGLSIGICMGTHTARIYSHKFWENAEPSAIALKGKQSITDKVMRDIFYKDQHKVRVFIKNVASLGNKVFVVSAPPIRLDHTCLAYVRREVVEHIDTLGRKLFTYWLKKNGIPYVSPPSEAYHENTPFLKDELAQKFIANGTHDPHHANPEYGKLLAMKIIKKAQAGEILS